MLRQRHIYRNIYILIIFILFLQTGCKRYTKRADPEQVVYALYEDVKDWDPATAFSLEVMILGNIYEPLHWYVADSAGRYHFRPGLATSFSKENNGLKWTFHLRKGVRFHDGRRFTSLAVKKSIQRVQRLGKGAAFIWQAVKKIQTPNDTTVVFLLSRPAPVDLIAASQYSAWIMSPAIADCTENYFRQGKACGTGPYRLTGWAQNEEIQLEKFKDYWGGWEGPHFSTVKFKIISEAGTRVQMIRSGEVDFAGLVPAENIAALRHNPAVQVAVVPSWRNMMFLLNTSKEPLNNIFIRKALQHAFDYDAAVQYIFDGFATRATAPVPKGMWGRAEDLPQPRFDLDLARSYIEKSGVPKDKLTLSLAYVASVATYQKCAMMLQNNLERIGIKLELKPGLWNVIWEQAKDLKTAPHIQSMTWWPSYPTPGDWLSGLFHSQNPNLFNLSHYHNKVYDRLIDRALELEGSDRQAAIALYKKAQHILYEDAVAIFFADVKVRLVKRKSISAFKPNPAYEMIYFYNLHRVNR